MSTFTFGPVVSDDGVLFRLWAPGQDGVGLKLDGRPAMGMQPAGDGWHHARMSDAGAGTRYSFVLPDGLEVPDPASRHQPEDVHGPSEVVDLDRYTWQATHWQGRPWEEIVLYELHVGAFTQAGSFLGAIERLDHLQKLGVTAIQLMPIAEFPGRYNWGYDGVLPYAPEASYGRPEDLMALVDAAHQRGVCVFLDVVYNHFGPDGNYLPAYAPLFTDKHKSPWGNGINYDDDGSRLIRDFVIENALYWVREFRVDGLRLDAVHEIRDDSGEHLLHELARRVRAEAAGRHVHLVVENEDNDSDLLRRDASGQASLFTAQWNDDVHHVLHVAATGEDFGYYADYAGDAEKVGRALAEGFVYQGERMPYRGKARGKPVTDLSPLSFVAFIQNHDQIGNRAEGDRVMAGLSMDALKALAAVYLLSPQIPMLFMGEEWGSKRPFPYFCDFNEELNEKVRQGRREELSRLPGFDAEDLLDPTAPETFAAAKLDWSEVSNPSSSETLSLYRQLLDIRRERILPLLKATPATSGRYRSEGGVIAVEWPLQTDVGLHLLANLSGENALFAPADQNIDTIYATGGFDGAEVLPWTVVFGLRRR